MPKKQKTSQAKHFMIRLNPINQHEGKALEIIRMWQAQGYTHKDLIIDRLLRAENITPEMFDKDAAPDGAEFFVGQVQEMMNTQQRKLNQALAQNLETTLAQFADELIKKLRRGGATVPEDDDSDDNETRPSTYARSFAKGFLQRKQQALGEDE